MTGVDLTRIDGADGFTALKVISEIGTDMTKWETAGHFASCLGVSLNNRKCGSGRCPPPVPALGSSRRMLDDLCCDVA